MIRRLLNFLPWRRAVNQNLEDLLRRCRNGSETRLEMVKEMSGFKKALGGAIGDLRELKDTARTAKHGITTLNGLLHDLTERVDRELADLKHNTKRVRALELDIMNAKHENEVLRVALVEASKALLPPRVTTDRSSDPL